MCDMFAVLKTAKETCLSMEWIEAIVKTKSEAIEIVTGYLMMQNIPNVRIIDDVSVDKFLLDHPLNWDYKEELKDNTSNEAELIFYLQNDNVGINRLNNIKQGLYELPGQISEIDFGDLLVKHGPVNDDDWLHEWKKTYKPFKIGKSIVVCPVWEDYVAKPGEIVFTIDPGAVFGTGLHATTQLCIMAMEEIDFSNKCVLDIGCGSGILSVIAMLLNASSATACDIDPGAARCALENATLNGIDLSKYEALTKNIFEDDFLKPKYYDIALANIVADVIVGLSPLVPKYLKDDGILVVSGIIDDRIDDVKKALALNKYKIISEYQKDGWYCAVTQVNHA